MKVEAGEHPHPLRGEGIICQLLITIFSRRFDEEDTWCKKDS